MAAAAGMVSLTAASKAHATGRHHHHWWYKPPSNDHHCLLRGTAIRTDKGTVAIEQLAIGDRVLTASGAYVPVTGIGRTTFRRAPGELWSEVVAPVRIARSAIADNVPERDLQLSPAHALLIDGCLIPVKHLVNGLNITQADLGTGDMVEYFHLEFAQHEVFYAEGAPVESLQVISRDVFATFDEYKRADTEIVMMAPYAPVLGYFGGRQNAMALLRLAVCPFIDVRDRIQVAYDRIVARVKTEERALAA
jgi:hypothetical protein